MINDHISGCPRPRPCPTRNPHKSYKGTGRSITCGFPAAPGRRRRRTNPGLIYSPLVWIVMPLIFYATGWVAARPRDEYNAPFDDFSWSEQDLLWLLLPFPKKNCLKRNVEQDGTHTHTRGRWVRKAMPLSDSLFGRFEGRRRWLELDYDEIDELWCGLRDKVAHGSTSAKRLKRAGRGWLGVRASHFVDLLCVECLLNVIHLGMWGEIGRWRLASGIPRGFW